MDIETHINLLLDKYSLKKIYYKFIILTILTSIIKESFYWSLIYFSEIVKEKPNLIQQFSILLITLIGLNVPVERYFNHIKANLLKEIKLANNKHFNDKIIHMSKTELLTFDLIEYFNILEQFNDNINEYILNLKNKYDIPIRCVTLVIIALTKKFGILIGLFAIFYAIVKSLNERKLIDEISLTKKYFQYESTIRNYIVNGKNFLVNDEFNKEYLSNNFNKFENVNKKISEINNNLDMNINIYMLIFIIIVIWLRFHELNQYDFFYYFLIIYDIEFIADKVSEYYKHKVNYNKMQERLNYLNKLSQIILTPQYLSFKQIDKIIINKINNNNPVLINTSPIIINSGDHILINGESGSGKTSLLYLMKGIIKSTELIIEPQIEIINSQTYLTLPNHKSLFSGNLYDIITNYDKHPNIDLINYSLEASKINHKLDKNEFVNIEQLSGGERIRLLIARIIYTVKTKNYSILLFDEIDENLNDELAYDIYSNLDVVFKDKIILYVTHNEKVKNSFKNKINVKNGIIE